MSSHASGYRLSWPSGSHTTNSASPASEATRGRTSSGSSDEQRVRSRVCGCRSAIAVVAQPPIMKIRRVPAALAARATSRRGARARPGVVRHAETVSAKMDNAVRPQIRGAGRPSAPRRGEGQRAPTDQRRRHGCVRSRRISEIARSLPSRACLGLSQASISSASGSPGPPKPRGAAPRSPWRCPRPPPTTAERVAVGRRVGALAMGSHLEPDARGEDPDTARRRGPRSPSPRLPTGPEASRTTCVPAGRQALAPAHRLDSDSPRRRPTSVTRPVPITSRSPTASTKKAVALAKVASPVPLSTPAWSRSRPPRPRRR